MSAILYDVTDAIATITINRPEKRNAMSFAVLHDFIEATKRASADDAARVVIVTGSGGSFCAGTDLSDLASRPPENRGLRGRADETDRWWPLVTCMKPVIGAVDGAAVGMGAEFTSQCDVRIASTRARFAWNFAHRGLVPDTGAGTWILPRLLGHSRALELLYSGRFVDALEAQSLGYVQKVVEPEKLQDEARALAASFLQGSPLSQRLIKELVYQSETRDFGQHMEAHTAAMKTCFSSEDHREGVASFLERRPAKFVGR
jgi:enoyl-CoA hydratase/carnithine racemase